MSVIVDVTVLSLGRDNVKLVSNTFSKEWDVEVIKGKGQRGCNRFLIQQQRQRPKKRRDDRGVPE